MTVVRDRDSDSIAFYIHHNGPGIIFDMDSHASHTRDDGSGTAFSNIHIDTAKELVEVLQNVIDEIENSPDNLTVELESTPPNTVVFNVAPGTQIVLNTTAEQV